MDERLLADHLERDDETRTVTAFPDGSVDTFYDVTLAGERLGTRDAFAEAIRGEWSDVFEIERTAREPGGHGPNLAAQAAGLGNDATAVGLLDHPVFETVPYETVSMGEPASVAIHEFGDGDILTVERSAAVESWTLADLRTALGDCFRSTMSADAVCCVNWTSIKDLPTQLESLADAHVAGQWLLVDPGAPPKGSNSDIVALLDALERLSEGYDVVLTGNSAEVHTIADGIGAATDDIDQAVESVRSETGIAAAVSHGEDWATVATAHDHWKVENLNVDPVRATGGGDRFDAGLVHALSRDWGWKLALELGNACASRYIATGETGTADDIAGFLRERA